jgi:Protein of unknown function (DUF2752)
MVLTTKKIQQQIIDIVSLQTPRGRLLFFVITTLAIYVAPYGWLSNLSIWQRLGIPSPSIGLTRAYWKLLHADPGGAWERNKLIYLVLAVGIPLLLKDCYTLWYTRKSKHV